MLLEIRPVINVSSLFMIRYARILLLVSSVMVVPAWYYVFDNYYHVAASDLLLKRATAIEKIVLEDHNGDMGRDYKGKIRSLFLNLKDKNNPGLRENVTSGELKVEKLCKMSSQVRADYNS